MTWFVTASPKKSKVCERCDYFQVCQINFFILHDFSPKSKIIILVPNLEVLITDFKIYRSKRCKIGITVNFHQYILNIFKNLPIRFSFLLLWKLVLLSAMIVRQVSYLRFRVPELCLIYFQSIKDEFYGNNKFNPLLVVDNNTVDELINEKKNSCPS